jgi:DNA-3-methyladenine glycosylase
MKEVINRDFYIRDTLTVAKELLGMTLCRRLEKSKILRGKIVETEAYTQVEPSCHAYRGITKRNATMFKQGGIAYVYFTYGMYYCLNIITEEENFASGVLIRAIEPLSDFSNTNGPSKLCRELNITTELNETNICTNKSPLWIEQAEKIEPENIVTTTRIGIKLAANLPWRFYIKDNKFVSKK